MLTATYFVLYSPHKTPLAPNFEALSTARFFPFVTSCLHFPLTPQKTCHTISGVLHSYARLLLPSPVGQSVSFRVWAWRRKIRVFRRKPGRRLSRPRAGLPIP